MIETKSGRLFSSDGYDCIISPLKNGRISLSNESGETSHDSVIDAIKAAEEHNTREIGYVRKQPEA